MALWLILLAPGIAAQEDATEAEYQLNEVRSQIESLQAKVRKASQRRGSMQAELRKSELAATEARGRLASLGKELAAARKRLKELERQVEASRAALATQRSELARQLRLAYMGGREEWLRVVLNQQNPVDISRQLVYYSYIARQRAAVMEGVRTQLASLRAATTAVANEQSRLEKLERDQATRLQELSAARDERSRVLAGLDAEIAKRSDRLGSLQTQAADLEALVLELTRLLSNLPSGDSVPFAKRQGAMTWPTDGRALHKFGDSRADGKLRWDGVLLKAAAGADVRAVHHGRVVFADWLPGMGLLVVLEHGDGFMSLYGHNQDLLKDVGEWVSPETIIARVGDTGGRADPGLYFEIRKDGSPVDPADWVAR